MSVEIKATLWAGAALVFLAAIPYALLNTDMVHSLTGAENSTTPHNVFGSIVSAIVGTGCLVASVEATKKAS